MSKSPVYFCFADTPGFSGQKAATQLIMSGLIRRGWSCRPLPQPVRQRESSASARVFIRYLVQLMASWLRSLRLLAARESWLHLNMGQTIASFLRDGVPLLLATLGLGRRRIVISLHGSLFMHWPVGSLHLRVFAFMLKRAGAVTVLGRRQAERLVALGLPADRVKIVPNSCAIGPITPKVLRDKHVGDETRAVKLLFLSSLIDTKGYPEYLAALRALAAVPGLPVEAVLCGRIAMSAFAERFKNEAQAEKWIEEQVNVINAGTRVRVTWVRGAVGAEKAKLFLETDIFVLPTRYPVEAQPIVILEAMASGCAIITTSVGEITTIVDERCAVLLPDNEIGSISRALTRLIQHPEERATLATAAWERFRSNYALDKHIDAWELLFTPRHKSSVSSLC